MHGHGRPVAGRPQQVDVAGREQGAGPGLPGGPAPGGPDGRVQALLTERPLDDGERRPGPAVPVGRGDEPGRPAEQPRLDLRGDQERDRPGPVGRGCGQPGDAPALVGYPPSQGPRASWGGLRRDPGRELDGEVDQLGLRPGGGWSANGIERAHAGPLGGDPGGRGAVRLTVRNAGREAGLGDRPGRAARLSGWAEPDAGPGDTRRTPSASG